MPLKQCYAGGDDLVMLGVIASISAIKYLSTSQSEGQTWPVEQLYKLPLHINGKTN